MSNSQRFEVLDHGFVRHIESWGAGEAAEESAAYYDNERGIIAAARQSTQGSFRGWAEDERLLKFLYNNKHSTPFEFAGMVLEIRAPIFVFREWHRHRVQAFSEMSARYAPLPELSYLPTIDRLFGDPTSTNKQARGVFDRITTRHEAEEWQHDLQQFYLTAQKLYQRGLDIGLPKEIARVNLPVGRYSQMRASASLRNWLAFLTLRMDPNAQYEIRQYANAVGSIIANQFPKTWELFTAQSSQEQRIKNNLTKILEFLNEQKLY